MERELRPRLCYLIKGMQGYGFHLHGERNKGGQIIRTVDPGSSADLGGLRAGDRVVEVNGENVESQTHHQVVDRIREVPHRTRLLVVDKETEDYLLSHGLACTEDIAIEMGTLSPRPSPMSTPSASPIPRETSPLLIKSKHSLMLRHSSVGSTISISTSILKRSSMMSSSTTDTEVNGIPTQGLKHSEVVSLIRMGGEELKLLLVDQQTDELFHRMGITPTSSHIKEIYVDATAAEPAQPTPSPSSELPTADPPIINVTLSNSPITHSSPKPRTNGSSASQSSRSSTTQSEISSSDMSIQVPDEDEGQVPDPFLDSGLRLSPTAAEAKVKVLRTRHKKRAPPMDWSKKQEIFSNF
ncbi:Na(+)/H(+) exchange regulatory cofactor NHE-RF2 isoform X2 [Gouania willdenowi]|uniref:Na(+)/H(+) exchange regulatory cofactor NHE-RF2-like n=1 Tax=Gouania willdenowi TaxID=441366 RepID=A0A8C5D4A6_GOUWI|nr:Na(+)/H(+) exchange regulatory cofactor NHE-RF2-like isoform X2 [Gouania willdenowi]